MMGDADGVSCGLLEHVSYVCLHQLELSGMLSAMNGCVWTGVVVFPNALVLSRSQLELYWYRPVIPSTDVGLS